MGEQTKQKAWSYGQFTNAMNRADWHSIGQGCYVHDVTKRKFYALTYEDDDIAWRKWASAQQTPVPF